jgi:D-glycero-D-manno-heptose 1,7-bisphosphate phosphatase
MSKRAVFVDRDGTLIEDTGFIRRVDEVKLLSGAAEAVARLNKAGWAVVVVTNQSGVARGLLTEKDIAATNERMKELLSKEGARVDAVYYCPHLPEGKISEYAVVCDCRKPRPGMFLRAAREHDVDLAGSVAVGDSARDVEAGLNAGTRAILLTESETRADEAPDACGQAKDLLSAVGEILGETPDPARGHESIEWRVEGSESTEKPAASKPRKSRKPHDESRETRKPVVQEASPAVSSEKEEAVSTEEEPIPVHRAPKEFTPEPEVAGETPAAGVEAGKVPGGETVERTEAEEPVAPDRPKEESRVIPGALRCNRCGGKVSLSDVEGGEAFDKDGVRLCRDCVGALRAQKARTREVTNDDMLRELQNITRALTFEKFSYWHVFGSIGQALAIGCLIITYFRNAAPEGLLWAIFFQLLALTFFVLGRQ